MNHDPPEQTASASSGAESPPERRSGLSFQTCYRHPDVVTGVRCTRCGRPICPDCMHQAPVGYQCPTCVSEALRGRPRSRPLRVGGRMSLAGILMGVNIGVFLLSMVLGGGGFGGRTRILIDLGALQPLLIADGQYWRLLSAMFLHANVFHILFNMYALYLFGSVIESTLGRARFLVIYFVAGFLASVSSFVFSDPRIVGVGASGAIFGLLGAWVAYNLRRRGTALASANLRTAVLIIAINVVFGMTVPGIDNFAHLGGLAAGAAVGFLAEGFGPRSVRPVVQVAGVAAMVAFGVALTAWRAGELSALM